ncbi:MAG TPA: hypothetical protein VGN32_15080 [Ktedonobacterales bacterium]|nr:hypothetical protein [Ktedonobacterales bacterium]
MATVHNTSHSSAPTRRKVRARDWPRRATPGSRSARRTRRRWQFIAGCFVVLCAAVVAGCGFQSGGDEIAFLRDGQLWTIGQDGLNPSAIAGRNVVGFAWSPSHHQIVVRTSAGAPPLAAGLAMAPDSAGNLSVTSADGGGTLTITPSVAGLARSDAWWNAGGNRLLYAEDILNSAGQVQGTPFYVLAQSDQPAGIARVVLQGGGDIPALAPDGAQVAAIDASGAVRLGKPGTSGRVLATGALLSLPTNNRPARLLWQPGHDALLFATSGGSGQVNLVLADLQGHTHTVGAVSELLDYAFAPDGSHVLIQTSSRFEVWSIGATPSGLPTYTWDESDGDAQVWWSPDARYVLVSDGAGLWLADLRRHALEHLLDQSSSAVAPPVDTHRFWHPLTGSPWSPDGAQIVFADSAYASWLGHALPVPAAGGGLYVASVVNARVAPTLIASGSIAWPSWSYLDPNASWLVAA